MDVRTEPLSKETTKRIQQGVEKWLGDTPKRRSPPKKWHKTYGTIVHVEPGGRLTVRIDGVASRLIPFMVRWRNGYGHSATDFGVGVRVKVYWPSERLHPKFRLVGS